MIKRVVIASFLVLVGLFYLSDTSVYAQSVVINELLPHPSSGSDWIELYNKGGEEVDLSGWKIEDSTSKIEVFANGTKIASGPAFLLIFAGNRLNNGGDTIKLKNHQEGEIDVKSYNQDPGEDVAIGRYPDGADDWGILTLPTQESLNSSLVPTPTLLPTVLPTKEDKPNPTDTPKPAEKKEQNRQEKSVPTPSPAVKKPVAAGLSDNNKKENISENKNINGSVLGEEKHQATSEALPEELSRKDSRVKQIIVLLGGGATFIFLAVVLSIKQKKRGLEE